MTEEVPSEQPKPEEVPKEEEPKPEEVPKEEETKPEETKKEEEELSPEEEDKKELCDAIKDLKPEEASDNIKSKLLSLSKIHLDYKKVTTDKYGKEYDILEDKYDKLYKVIDNKIDLLVNSTSKIEDITEEDKTKYGIVDDDEGKEHIIEDYWNKVIINSRYFTVTEKDKKILKYIKRVSLEKLNVNDFRVDFIFQENEFFTPETISKTYLFDKEAVLKKAESTKIEWKSKEKNPTVEKIKKKKKKGKKITYEEKEEKVDSFFAFFNSNEDMSFLTDEVTFFKEDLFTNQLEYYLDIVSKTKIIAGEEDEDDEDLEDQNDKNDKDGGGDDKNKEECKQQ